jgi:hypothetical protein
MSVQNTSKESSGLDDTEVQPMRAMVCELPTAVDPLFCNVSTATFVTLLKFAS